MYGLEKGKGKGDKGFAFDLEEEISKDPNRAKEILKNAEKCAGEIKKLLREGTNEKEFEPLGTILHGYTAVQKVIKKIAK